MPTRPTPTEPTKAAGTDLRQGTGAAQRGRRRPEFTGRDAACSSPPSWPRPRSSSAVFTYYPMITGSQMAFRNWNLERPDRHLLGRA